MNANARVHALVCHACYLSVCDMQNKRMWLFVREISDWFTSARPNDTLGISKRPRVCRAGATEGIFEEKINNLKWL